MIDDHNETENDLARQTLDVAVQHHTAGRLAEAETLYKQILQSQPRQPQALHLLGVIALQVGNNQVAVDLIKQSLTIESDVADVHGNLGNALRNLGRLEEAVASYQMAISINPEFVTAFSNLGNALREQGRHEEALGTYQQALSISPESPDVLYNLGNAYKELGRIDEAVGSYQNALAIKPDYPAAHNNLGNALVELARIDEALACFHRAVSIRPTYAEAHINLGRTLEETGRMEEALASFRQANEIKPDDAELLNSMGNVLRELERLDEAVACYGKSLAINPDSAEAHSNLGVAAQESGHFDDAISHYQRALAIKPDYAEVLSNLGASLHELGKLSEAMESLGQATTINPEYAEAHYNMGVTLEKLGLPDTAEACYRQATAIRPDYADAHFGLANILLQRGELKTGWLEHEWRIKKKAAPTAPRHFPQARWNGEALQGKSILLWGEQGIGDEIRFASIIPDIISMAGACSIECEPRLVDLFARSFPEARVHAYPFAEAENGVVAFDYQMPTPSLPLYLRSSIEEFPERTSYLVADESRQQHWQERIDALGDGLKIGVSWRSHLVDPSRSRAFATIADLQPLLGLKNAVFINLQYDECAAEVSEFEERYGLRLHNWDDIDLKYDIEGAMALTACLDVVVTLLSAVYEMSGALGIPTYTFHPESTCAISLGTENIPFHPSVRLYKRHVNEGWRRVLTEITEEIGKITKL